MGLDGGRSIGIPKSSSERYSKSEFSDSEFVFGGVKFNGGIGIGDWGRERDGDLGGDSDLGAEREVERVMWGVVEIGIWVLETVMWRAVERGIWGVETVMWRVMERGILGVGMFAYFAKQGEFWERVEGELVLQGNQHVVLCLYEV